MFSITHVTRVNRKNDYLINELRSISLLNERAHRRILKQLAMKSHENNRVTLRNRDHCKQSQILSLKKIVIDPYRGMLVRFLNYLNLLP